MSEWLQAFLEKLIEGLTGNADPADVLGLVPSEQRDKFYEPVNELFTRRSFKREGTFIVVSGIDKTGKETQVFLGGGCVRPLYEHLSSKWGPTVGIRQPSYDTYFGSLIREYLNGRLGVKKEVAWALWSLDRAQHNSTVRDALIKGKIVVAKRWTESNVIYQAANGINPELVLAVESNIVKQDLTVVMDMSPDEVFKRSKSLDMYERLDLLERVRDIYLRMRYVYPFGDTVYLSSAEDECTVNTTLLSVVDCYLDRVKRKP